ncbi:uncharacterized protein N7515_005014 [Penicillium bovifimosum]|uniref:Uncharacterized protein n=1 Tax=Penicillium bovifimosum TaxID=126998 RepID=A0A9W9L416_9EURO|nr:uncharacterized protein N7515_005014 [Penicillium bovifimosum]KAJ5135736.1 hypothetical protein N7515_005014 [Penicillium bovifimosum]
MSSRVTLGPYSDHPPGPVVFTQEQIRCLEEAAIFLPEPQPNTSTDTSGKRKVSAAFSAPRSVSNSLTSSSSSASVTTRGFQSHVIQTFEIPMAEESVEVLEYIGFIPDVARLIYDRYCNRPSPTQNPDDLMTYVSGHLASLHLRQYDDMGHQEALAHTLAYWAKDTVETRYAALLGQQQVLQSQANQRMAHKRNMSGRGLSLDMSPADMNKAHPSSNPRQQRLI